MSLPDKILIRQLDLELNGGCNYACPGTENAQRGGFLDVRGLWAERHACGPLNVVD